MKTQQAAEREEQQRIKNLVLNYDLTRDGEDQDGNYVRANFIHKTNAYVYKTGLDSAPSPLGYGRADKFNNTRGGQRSRKLQLSDVDWYGSPTPIKLESPGEEFATKSPFSLSSYFRLLITGC